MNKFYMFAMPTIVACGGYTEDVEYGTSQQDMSTKFSPLYTHGLSKAGTSKKCMVALGAGAGQTCLLPGYSTVRFKVTGSDPYSGNFEMSWKYQFRRALQFSFKDYATITYNYGFPFTVVEEDTTNTWLEATSGACPGNASSNNITSFACLQWDLGNSTTVSENLVGDYMRFTGKLKVIFDVAKMQTKTNYFAPSGSIAYDFDFHEMVEHAAHAMAPAAFGSGVYLQDQFLTRDNAYSWSSPSVELDGANLGFKRSGYSEGEVCRAGNWNSQSTGSFSAANGSCLN